MSEQSLPAPKNDLVEITNKVIDYLIKGLGENAAIAAAEEQAPWLAMPVIKNVFRFFVDLLATSLDDRIKINIDIIIIRHQNDSRKEEYDKHVEEIKKPGATPEQIQAAKDALDSLVNRNKH